MDQLCCEEQAALIRAAQGPTAKGKVFVERLHRSHFLLDPSWMLSLFATSLIKTSLELLSTRAFPKGPLGFSWKTETQRTCFDIMALMLRLTLEK